jgi:hypothetical protein
MSELKITGCYFTPSMRTLCSLLELNEISFQATDVDVFANQRKT